MTRHAHLIAGHREAVAEAVKWAAGTQLVLLEVPEHQAPESKPVDPASGQPCLVCSFKATNHWWGQPGSHCPACHRSLVGLREIHCGCCHAHFDSPSASDLHKSRSGRCVDPAQVLDQEGRPKLIANKSADKAPPQWPPAAQ